ncbi:MAG: Rrf2 family transcriptional regulator [Planctomycetota bacterium]|nr:MAG: Rrf2 family transcriptional regulator [Planctomycetota bacterium]
MFLNQTIEYAFRAMAYLAIQEKQTPLRAKDLASYTDVPLPYLSKIMRRLVTAGLLASHKGHGGGFQLAKSPQQIRFLDILQALDYPLQPNRCAFGWGNCDLQNPCPLHQSWSNLNEKLKTWAETNTLASLTSQQNTPPTQKTLEKE